MTFSLFKHDQIPRLGVVTMGTALLTYWRVAQESFVLSEKESYGASEANLALNTLNIIDSFFSFLWLN